MGILFVVVVVVVADGMTDHSSITAIDSTLLKAKEGSSVWHKSNMKKGIVPHYGIDT